MKKNYFSLIVVFCLIATTAAASQCFCGAAFLCHSNSGEVFSKPQCHPRIPDKQPGGSQEGCCGKCQIEPAAVFSGKWLLTRDYSLALRNLEKLDGQAVILSPQTARTIRRGKFYGPPFSFFIENILNASLGFRAPPGMMGCF